jgi:hypothetical protein
MVIIIGPLLQFYNGTHFEPNRMNIEDERNGGGIFFTLFDCKGFFFWGGKEFRGLCLVVFRLVSP